MLFILIGLYIFVVSLIYDFGNKKGGKNFNAKLILLTLIIVSSIRYRIGGDTVTYADSYVNFPDLFMLISNPKLLISNRYAPLWMIYEGACRTISSNFVIVQFTQTLFVNLVIYKLLKKYTPYLFLGLFIYYCYAYFRLNFEVMREAIAICIFGLSFKYFLSSKWFKYYLMSILALGFHYSAFIVFLLPFFKSINYKKGILFLSSALILLIIFGNLLLYYFNDLFISLFGFGDFQTDLIAYYTDREMATNQIIFYFLQFMGFPFFIVYLAGIIKYKTPYDSMIIPYFFIGLMATFIIGMYRLANYQIIMSIIYLSGFIGYLNKNKYHKLSQLAGLLTIFIFIIFSYTRIYLVMYKDTSHVSMNTHFYNVYYPYYTVFDEQKYPPRERLLQKKVNI